MARLTAVQLAAQEELDDARAEYESERARRWPSSTMPPHVSTTPRHSSTMPPPRSRAVACRSLDDAKREIAEGEAQIAQGEKRFRRKASAEYVGLRRDGTARHQLERGAEGRSALCRA